MTGGQSLGISGHQARPGLDWSWVQAELRAIFTREGPLAGALTSLAVGSDQLFASEALAAGVAVTAVIPMPDYERCFEPEARTHYRRLLSRCAVVQLPGAATDEAAFHAAGIYVADHCDALVAVWDGKPAGGLGGTADIVAYCRALPRRVIHLDPFARTVRAT